MNKLSKKQQDILDFIKHEIKTNNISPSIREICSHFGLKSTATAHYYLEMLEQKGYLIKDGAKKRSIRILEKDFYRDLSDMISVPVLGKVTAGEPILAVEDIEETYLLPKQLVKGEEVFILRISGDSMIDAGIFNKDLVIVRKQSFADNGDIVIALIDDSATCKRFFKEDNHFRLQPENESYSPIIADTVYILGKVIGLFRKY